MCTSFVYGLIMMSLIGIHFNSMRSLVVGCFLYLIVDNYFNYKTEQLTTRARVKTQFCGFMNSAELQMTSLTKNLLEK